MLALLLAPITNYPTVLTLLLLDSYQPLLALQTYSTRKAVAQAIISSVLRNETIISEPEEVNGVLEMCDVLIRDQKDAPVITTAQSPAAYGNTRNRKAEFSSPEQEELAEEQGWLARIIHLLRSDDEDKQFLVRCHYSQAYQLYFLMLILYFFSFHPAAICCTKAIV